MSSMADTLSDSNEVLDSIQGTVTIVSQIPARQLARPDVDPGPASKKWAYQCRHKRYTFRERPVITLPPARMMRMMRMPKLDTVSKRLKKHAKEPGQLQTVPEESGSLSTVGLAGMDEMKTDTDDKEGKDEGSDEDEDTFPDDYMNSDDEEEIIMLQKKEAESAFTGQQLLYMNASSRFKAPASVYVMKHLNDFKCDLSHARLGLNGFNAVMATLVTNISVRRLDLSECRLTKRKLQALDEALFENSCITDLILCRNGLTAKKLGIILPKLEKRSLDYLDISDNPIGDKDAELLTSFLHSTASLQYFHAKGCHLGMNFAVGFGNALRGNEYMKYVTISWNVITAEGVAHIMHGLANNTSICDLDIGWNAVGYDGVGAVVDTLKAKTALRFLGLAGTQINGEGFLALIDGLEGNETLNRLQLDHNPILSNDITEALLHLASTTSSALLRLDLKPMLIEKRCLSIVNSLLRQNKLDVRYGGVLERGTFIMFESENTMNELMKLRDRDKSALVRYFYSVDMKEFQATHDRNEEPHSESFIFKVINKTVTYCDLLARIKMERPNVEETVKLILEKTPPHEDELHTNVTRYSITSNQLRIMQLKSQ